MGFIRQTQPLAVDDGAWAVVNAAMGEGGEALFAGVEFLHRRVNACQVMAANAHIRLIKSVSTSYSLFFLLCHLCGVSNDVRCR